LTERIGRLAAAEEGDGDEGIDGGDGFGGEVTGKALQAKDTCRLLREADFEPLDFKQERRTGTF
jgi:hypothetical protein